MSFFISWIRLCNIKNKKYKKSGCYRKFFGFLLLTVPDDSISQCYTCAIPVIVAKISKYTVLDKTL